MIAPAMRFILHPLLAVLLTAAAQAHPFLQDAMWVLFEPERVRVAVNVSLKEIEVAQQLAADANAETVAAAAEKHGAYVMQHLRLSAGGHPLEGTLSKFTPPPERAVPEKTFFQYELEYALTAPAPASITFFHDMLREFPYALGTAWDVSYAVRMRSGESPDITTGLLRFQQPADFATGWGSPSAQAPAPAHANAARTFRDYLWHGVKHILTGYDHLLFVTALVLATLRFWEMVKVIAAFTLAHTITLALSVFDVFRLPPWIVEPVIAASIVFVAVENIVFPQRARSRARLVVAFCFGLVHGLGFAGGLLDAMEGLPAAGTWIALGAFSIGVEIGHQIVVLPLFGALGVARERMREGVRIPVLRCGSAAVSLCGVYYLAVALHGQLFAR
jgi:hypothetical protein